MQNRGKKLLAAVLCIAMVLALTPVSTFAETVPHNGAPSDREPDGASGEVYASDGTEKTVFTIVQNDAYPEKDLHTEPLSAWNGAETVSDKPVCDVFLTDPATKKAGEQTESEAERSSVYSAGSIGLGNNDYTINANDTTFFQFVPEESGTYRFYTVASEDTYGYLQDVNKSTLIYNDDGGYGANFMITYSLTAGQTYYVGARYYDSTKSGGFTVRAERIKENSAALTTKTNVFEIGTGGDTVYRAFTPSVSGAYYFYSLATSDTYVCLADSTMCVFAMNDDGGYGSQFEIVGDLVAGTTYWLGVSYYSGSVTGTIPVIIEQRNTDSNALRLGLNWMSISEPGQTVYRPFTVPRDGRYWFYSTSQYSETSIAAVDTYGTLADSSMKVLYADDDGGYGGYHKLGMECEKDQVYYVGMRFYNDTTTGTVPLFVEYPYADNENPLAVGDNVRTNYVAGSTIYYPFTPAESGTYCIESVGSTDTIGNLATETYKTILYSDDDGDGNNFRYSYDLEAGTKYYIGLRFYGETTGDITVRITKTASLLPAFDGKIEWNESDVQYRGTTPYVVFNGAAFTPRFTVKDKDGAVVDPSHYTYEYRENTNAGTAYVIVTFKDLYAGTTQGWFKIYLPPTTATTVENVSNGIRICWEPVTGAAGYVVYRRAWSSTTNGWTDFLRWNNTTSLSFTDVTVYAGTRYQYGVKAYFAQRVDPVSGATIGGNVGDNYNLGVVGPLKTTVRITTRKLLKLEAGSSQVKASWDASKVFTGYQLKYATDAAFTKNVKTVSIDNAKTASKAITGLKNGTAYYACVRSYHFFEGTKYFGEWSNTLTVKPGSGQVATIETYRAVVVGESAYTSASVLTGCVNDAAAITGMLKGLPTPYSVTTLKNASRSQIISAIRAMCSATKEGDVSLFTFSGHGIRIIDSNENPVYTNPYFGALLTVEGGKISFETLAAELSQAKGRVIVLLDSCHSGASISKSAGGTDELDAFTAAAIEAFAAYDTTATRMGDLKNSKFVVIAAASYTQSSYDGRYDGSGYYQGAFSAAIVKGLGAKYPNGARNGSAMPADKNGNKQVTLKELYDYTYQTAYNWTKSGGSPQRAQYYGTDSEVLFRR